MSDAVVRRVSVNVARKFNLGNFESIQLEAFAYTDIPMGETFDDAYDRMFDVVHEAIQKQASKFNLVHYTGKMTIEAGPETKKAIHKTLLEKAEDVNHELKPED